MNKKIVSFTSALTILFLAMSLHRATVEVALCSPTTTISVDPPTITVVGKTFTININISDVVDLYGWEFRFRWNSTLLDAVNVTEGTFLKQGGDTFFANKTDNIEGYILVDCTLIGDVPGVSGHGILAIVEFYVEDEGESILDLYGTTLVSSSEQPIVHTSVDGTVKVLSPPVAIFTCEPTGLVDNITVVTFNASASHDPDGFIVSYAWDFGDDTPVVVETDPIVTHNFTAGTYDVTLTVTDNEGLFDSTTIALGIGTLLGDVNNDGIVDIFDVVLVAKAFGSNPEDPNWNSDADLNNDGVIDIYDIVIIAIHFGESLP